jgi:hypothetical protein
MKINDVGFFVVFFIVAFVWKYEVPYDTFSTIYQVLGTMFSICIAIVVNLFGVRNEKYLSSIRENIKNIRDKFSFYFVLSSFGYILTRVLKDNHVEFMFNYNLFFFFINCYSMVYFIRNFLSIQNLSEEIQDRLNREK